MRSSILLILLSGLAARAAAQSNAAITPSNDTQHRDSASFPDITLSISTLESTYALDTLFARVPADSPIANYLNQPITTGGLLDVTSNASDSGALSGLSVGYVCCDPGAYSTPNGLNDLLSTIAARQGNGTSTSRLIFYSRTSFRCTVDAPGVVNNSFSLFTITNAQSARDLETQLQRSGGMNIANIANITNGLHPNDTGGEDTRATSGGEVTGGSSPGATVAMIILYIITGLITLGFISVIVAGAVRAHRHPEWYREANVEGGGGRHRVLGRAILDSIPIVKFGQATPNKPNDNDADGNDVELEDGRRQPSQEPQSQSQPSRQPPSPTSEEHAATETAASEPVTRDAIVRSTHDEPEPATETPAAAPDADTDGAIAPATAPVVGDASAAPECAICVEPFQQGDDMRVLPQCEHQFHPACLDPWLLNVSSTCPLCRLDLRPPSTPANAPANDHATAPTAPTNPLAADGTPADDDAVMWLVPTNQPGVYLQIDPRTIGHHSHRRTRLAGAWSRLLSRQRLREASPHERVVALRELRAARRASEATEVPAAEQGPAASTDGTTSDGNVVIVEEAPGQQHDATTEPPTTHASSLAPPHRRGDHHHNRLSRLFGRRPAFPAASDEPSSPSTTNPPASPMV